MTKARLAIAANQIRITRNNVKRSRRLARDERLESIERLQRLERRERQSCQYVPDRRHPRHWL